MNDILKFFLIFVLFCSVYACGSSGSCGCCGCRAKAKARAAKTNSVDMEDFDERDDGNIFGLSIWNNTNIQNEVQNKERVTNPNFLFHRCCEERRLPPSCIQQCHFNAFTRDVLHSIFLGTHQCPMEFLAEMQFCAAQGMDHRRCCSARGVGGTTAGTKCLTFCDQRPDLYTPVDYSYAPCFERFENMKRCFYEDVRTAAERRFLPMLTDDSSNEAASDV
ncbi:unnamed protein product [Auanema sp. JU1783]|nr:unnamed protein product [Auanema sp. JU1783]